MLALTGTDGKDGDWIALPFLPSAKHDLCPFSENP